MDLVLKINWVGSNINTAMIDSSLLIKKFYLDQKQILNKNDFIYFIRFNYFLSHQPYFNIKPRTVG